MCDLIKTINDDEEVQNFSEDSDVEIEYQPKKRKTTGPKDFDIDFKFVSNAAEYNQEPWNDLKKYITRKATNKVNEKIEKSREWVKDFISGENESNQNLDENDNANDENELSDVDMKTDAVKVREKQTGKRKKKRKETVTTDNGNDHVHVEAEDSVEFFEDAPPYDESSSFYQMNLSRPLMKAISLLNYAHPTPIQAATIPVALLGRDICGCAATGTGKTAAYMLPILERLLYRPKNYTAVTRVLILVPTRELGVQVYQVTKQLAQFTSIEVGLSVGGLELKVQEHILRKNPDVVIATPGRLIDHLQNTPTFSLEDLEVLVLDEADRMLDENFSDQMKHIAKMCSRTRQTLLFSATMTEAINELASVCLSKPVKIFVDSNQDVAFNLRQEFVRLREGKESDRDALLAALVCRTFRDHTMVFVRTKAEAHRVLILLGLFGIKVVELHGNLTQPQRLDALRKFKQEEADVLVATDVAARGLDISGVKTVINYIIPPTLEHYIHRVGRTARAGKSGVSVSIATEDDRKIIKEIIKHARNPVKNRVIPAEIVVRYKEKVEGIRDEVRSILTQEREEREINRMEKQVERTQNILKNVTTPKAKQKQNKREWFQSAFDRSRAKMQAKEKFEEKIDKKGKRRNKKSKPKDEQELVQQKQMQNLALRQAKQAKKNKRQTKIRAVDDNFRFNVNLGNKSKRKSAFDDGLVDVSRKGVKSARYLGPKNRKPRK